MADFVGHESCPKCGSRDNLARYDDGGAWCFGCHYREPPTHAPMRYMGHTTDEALQWQERGIKPLPDDINHEFSQECVEWLQSFHLDIPTAIQYGLVWSPSYEQLIYQLGNVWQARNFNPERKQKRKNYTSGNVNECLHIYESGLAVAGNSADHLIIVEDPVSAIRIASGSPRFDAMPLLGSHLAPTRLNAIAGLYSSLVFWLDSDKWKEAVSMADRAKFLGLETRVVWTEHDPKCYTNEEIERVLSQTPTQESSPDS